MKRFKVEHNDYDIPVTYITLFHPPYETENILHKTGLKEKDVTITEVIMNHGEE